LQPSQAATRSCHHVCGVVSLRHVRALCRLKEYRKHILKLFSLSGRSAILVFSVPNRMAILRREPLPPLLRQKIAIFDQHLASGSMTSGVSSFVNKFRPSSRYVDNSKRRLRWTASWTMNRLLLLHFCRATTAIARLPGGDSSCRAVSGWVNCHVPVLCGNGFKRLKIRPVATECD